MIATETRAEVLRLKALLRKAAVGEIVTLTAMTDEIGMEITANRWILYSAAAQLQRDEGLVFANVRKVGYRRLPVVDIPTLGKTARDRIRRTAQRGAKALQAGTMAVNDIPEATRRQLLREQSALSLLAHMSRDKSLPEVTAEQTAPLTMAEVTRQFMDRMRGR